MQSKMKTVLVIFIGIIIGIIITIYSKYWNDLTVSFWEIKFTEVVELVIYGFIGIYLSFYLTQRFSDTRKKKEIILCILQELNEFVLQHEEIIIDQLRKKANKSSQREVLLILKRMNNKISIIMVNKLCKQNSELFNNLQIIEKKYIELKESITGEEWGIIDTYSVETIDQIKRIFPLIYLEIDRARIALF